MNCEQGELAVIVGASHPGTVRALGHICVCVELVKHPITGEPGWRIDPPVQTDIGLCENCLDRVMRPIRPQSDDAFDEMLLIAGLPAQVIA